jgi:hypothetical protein
MPVHVACRVADEMPSWQLLLPFDALFGACVLTTKLSVLFFYRRVFTGRAMRIATTVTLVLVVLWGIGNLLQTFLVCHIMDGVWYDFKTTSPLLCSPSLVLRYGPLPAS